MTPKSAIASNIPQLRLIEIVWGNMMHKLYSNNFVAKTEEELIKIEIGLNNLPACMSSSVNKSTTPKKYTGTNH